MALLVQEYADDIVANGVAISLIPFRKDFPGLCFYSYIFVVIQ